MYKLTFLDYNYDNPLPGDCFHPGRIKVFESFIGLVQYCKTHTLYMMSDEYMITCGTRFIHIPGII